MSRPAPNLYDVLGVPKGANPTEIKKAYLKMARTHHPDKGGDPEKFKEIAHANEVLSDEVRRRRYDETGSTDEQMAGGMPGGGGPFPFPFDVNVNLSDLFGNMFGHGPNGPMGPNGPVRKGKKPVPNTQTIPLRLEHFYLGHQFDLNINRQAFCGACDHTGAKVRETCKRCNGQGMVTQVVQMGPMAMHTTGPCMECQGKGQRVLETCGKCAGSGFTNETKKLTVHFPPGSRPQETFIFPEVCSDHPAFERPGDVHIVVQEDPSDPAFQTFRRVGDQLQHLETRVSVSLSECLLGVVVTLEGHPGYDEGLPIQLPAGSFHGDVYVLSGLGMPMVRENGKYGDLRVRVEASLSEEERERLSVHGADVLRPLLQPFVRGTNASKESIQTALKRVKD